jgi:hypothetical protein
MILTAALHTAGNLAARQDSAEEIRVLAAMASLHFPLGMGMQPSLRDIYLDLVWTMSITMGALGVLNLVVAGSSELPDRVLRRVAWVNLIWVTGFLWLAWAQQVPPPLISGVVIEAFVIGSVIVTSRR